MVIFHYAPNTIALASLIALEEAGAAYRAVRVDFAANEQRGANYLKVNPKGRVPALVTGRGILTETPAILAYIAQSYPAARLAPLDDPFAFAQLQAFCAYLCSTVHPSHSMRVRGARWSDDPAVIEALKIKVPANVRACFTIIETDMFEGPWVMGAAYTFADPYLYTLTQWLGADGVDLQEFPKIAEHHQRMNRRLAVHTALQVERSA